VRASDGEWHEVEVMGESDELGGSLFDCAVKNQWRLSELKRESASLEDVFIQLTKG
jgi:hypothetical protein